MEKIGHNRGITMETNLHKGHRKRVKEDFLRNGFDHHTPPHKILEMLLFFCVVQGDTNGLAHELLKRYKTLSGVFNAPVNELVEFKGITESNVVLLKMIMPLFRVCAYECRHNNPQFKTFDQIGDFLLDEFMGYTCEQVCMLCLDTGGHMLSFEHISDGDPASVGLSIRDVIKVILDCNASGVILAHNHPSGIALPSAADIEITAMLASALSHIGVRLIDHLIISDGDYVSMRNSKEFKEIFYRTNE